MNHFLNIVFVLKASSASKVQRYGYFGNDENAELRTFAGMGQYDFDNDWRRVAAAIYRKPTDSKVFGSVELDVTDLEAYITEKRQEGLKITLTHIFLLAVARAMREEVPEFNCYVRRGRIVSREHVDATVSVLIKGGSEMGAVKVRNADQLTLAELAQWLAAELPKSRQGKESRAMKAKAILAAIPWPLRIGVFGLIKRITIDWGLSFPKLGLTPDSFGSFVLSNIGSLGLDIGYPALLPSSNVAIVVVLGSANTKPAVVDGQVVPRRLLTMGAAIDHRVADAAQAGRLFRYLKQVVGNPEVLETKPRPIEPRS
jgi:pyruvate/2-oxoglutarate dehydrogenase complex dihydrolipoamide acyltransferase (E2) component